MNNKHEKKVVVTRDQDNILVKMNGKEEVKSNYL